MAVIRVLEAISAGFGVVWQRGETQDVSDDLARLLVTQRRAEYVSPPAAPADWLVPVMQKVDVSGLAEGGIRRRRVRSSRCSSGRWSPWSAATGPTGSLAILPAPPAWSGSSS